MNNFVLFFWVFVRILSSLKWFDSQYDCLLFYNSCMLGHISLYDAIEWFFSNAITVFQNMSKISYWSCIDMLSKPASMSTAQLLIQYLGNTVLKCMLCKNCHRSNRLPLTIYAIVFYAGFSPALEVQKSVIFYTLLSFSQFTKRAWTRYVLSVVFLVTGMSVIVKV